MSEPEANERRPIKEGSISGLVHTAVNADASEQGRRGRRGRKRTGTDTETGSTG